MKKNIYKYSVFCGSLVLASCENDKDKQSQKNKEESKNKEKEAKESKNKEKEAKELKNKEEKDDKKDEKKEEENNLAITSEQICQLASKENCQLTH